MLSERVKALEAGGVASADGDLWERVRALEERPNSLIYRGVWSEAEQYIVGDTVTWNGGMWCARSLPLGARPGHSSSWQLCVKGVERQRR
jgi:hypothetical protein